MNNTTTKLVVSGHALNAIYRTYWALDKHGNRLSGSDFYEEYDELKCANCGEYFETEEAAQRYGQCDNDK